MKIKYRIVLLFTALVTTILLIICVSIFYLSEYNRQDTFRKRLYTRALISMNLLTKIPGIDKELFRKIDEATLPERSIMVYKPDGSIYYSYANNNTSLVPVNAQIIENLKKQNEYYFSAGDKEGIALFYYDNDNKYLVINAANDADGLEKHVQLQKILLLSFVIGVLITFVSGLFFSKKLVDPIKKITREVNEISSGNLSRRIQTREPNDELNELAITFNDLMNRLQESFEIQGRFISNASHEMSTPLTSILSQLEITLQKERHQDEYKDVIQSVYEDVINLSQLTKTLLDITKASGSSKGIELLLIRIDELLLKLPYTANKADAKYLVKLHFDTFPEDEERLFVFGNADLLFSAIKNIVLNACKYSNNHTAYISLHFEQQGMKILVSDNGPGIHPKDIPHIYQPFYRGENSGSEQGFGLGLSLAQKIISIHKGNIQFRNKEEGGGEFAINIPFAGAK